MYKDKAKQREANRERQRRYRDWKASGGVTQGVTDSGRDKQGVTDIERDKAIEFMAKTAGKAERAGPKRGKDIKSFRDLPLDVQVTINRMSFVDGKTDLTIKANRTAIAINYQHLFPGMYEPKSWPNGRLGLGLSVLKKKEVGGPSEKAKPPKPARVALSTT